MAQDRIQRLSNPVDDPVFMEAALGFTKDAFLSAEILKLLPSSVGPYVALTHANRNMALTFILDF
jgi:hypothetical protein